MSGPHPAVAAVRSAVLACLADLTAQGPDGRRSDTGLELPLVLVACSGGQDSLALAAATAAVAQRAGVRAGAVVVDHGLQPTSADVAARTAVTCAALGLDPVEVVAVVVDGPGGPEAAAREARYAALDEVADRLGAAALLLGHTLDDQAESVLLGLGRGSGARSLAGMPAARGRLRRPVLGLRRAQTAAACAALGLEPHHDPTNTPDASSGAVNRRALVRHRALPELERAVGPGVATALARTAELLRQDAEVLDQLAAQLLGTAALDAGAALDVAALASAPAALRRRALRAALLAWGAPRVHASHVDAVEALVVDWHGQGPVDVPGLSVARRCGRLTPDVTT